ncbi:hypothetical protein [Bacillus velezensis]|uniref:hypothetical protein n=1 Tax=Bacillus velezensis TaxID=492670 RepID=UPI0011A143F8|nr:hypothetical protein [Bacillus velezensis]
MKGLTVMEQIQQLIIDIKIAKEDLETTDLDILDSDQLSSLANECLTLITVCNKLSNEIKELEAE